MLRPPLLPSRNHLNGKKDASMAPGPRLMSPVNMSIAEASNSNANHLLQWEEKPT